MKNAKRILCVLLAAALLLCLAACGKEKDGQEGGSARGAASGQQDASTLVKARLDGIYLGQASPEDTALLTGGQEALEAAREDNLNVNVEYFARTFGIENLTEELRSTLKDLYKEIFSHAKYTVGTPEQMDETTWAVPVEVQPIDLVEQMKAAQDEWMAPYYAKYGTADYNAMSEEQLAAADAEWAALIVSLAQDKLSGLGYKDPEALGAQIVKAEDGTWTVSEDDLYTIDEYIVYFPDAGI